MMSSEAGYTTALLKTAQQLNKVAQVSANLPLALELVSGNARFFKSPKITAREKADMLEQILRGHADELTVAFVVMLAQRNRLRYLPGVCKRFKKLANESLGRATIRITLPYDMGSELLEKLKLHLVELGMCRSPSEEDTEFEVIVDKGIIGGFIAESESKIVDMSIRTRLNRLRQTNIR